MDGVTPRPPLANSYWVVPGSFLAGQYPGSLDLGELTNNMNGLLKAGIMRVLNLMEDGELNFQGIPFAPYGPELARLARIQGHNVRADRVPIRDMAVPSLGVMKQILGLVDRSLARNEPVYVHCLGGRGRTGTVVGCWLRRHGLAESATVLDRIRELREKGHRIEGPSPEAPEQLRIVRAWPRGQ